MPESGRALAGGHAEKGLGRPRDLPQRSAEGQLVGAQASWQLTTKSLLSTSKA